MSATTRQVTNAAGFPKPAELIEITGASALEAQDRAVLNVLYQHAHDSGRLTQPGAKWEIAAAALRTSRHESNDRLRDTLVRLMQVVVHVTFTDSATGNREVLMTHLFRFFNRSVSGAGVVRFGIPEELGPVLVASGRWGRIRAETVCAMTSKYAIALYEMVQLRSGMDNCVETFPVERFRDLMGVPEGAYQAGKDFARAVDLAVLEVNGLSDFGVQVQVVRRHPKAAITAVTVAWWRKDAGGFRSAMAEMRQPKAGRRSRLEAAQAAAPAAPPPVAARKGKSRGAFPGLGAVAGGSLGPEGEAVVGAAGAPGLSEADVHAGCEAAASICRIDRHAAHADWCVLVAGLLAPPRDPAGHFADFCCRRARELA